MTLYYDLTTSELCYLWNAATNPAVLRSDTDSLIARDEARAIRAELGQRSGWAESENGRLYIIERS